MSRWIFSAIAGLLMCSAWAQSSKAELEKQQAKIKDNIAYTEKLLKQVAADSKNSASQIALIRNKISQREALIHALSVEVAELDSALLLAENEITNLENELTDLREQYARLIIQANRTKSNTDKMMFLFASEDFNQAYQRLKYMQTLADFRRAQAEAIALRQSELVMKKEALKTQRDEKSELLQSLNNERMTLDTEKQQKEMRIKELGSQEAKYKKELAASSKKAEEIKQAIKKIIEEEIRARNAAAGSKSTSATFSLSPEALELSANFASNRGKLPWPVDKGEIVARYGEQPHPFLPGIVIKKDGITIATTEGNKARCVFEGEVTKILIIPGAGKIVMVRHGEYISVYMNLKETFVTTGDKVGVKEELGTILSEKGETEFEFQLWKGTVLQDPSQWLYQAR